VVSFPCRSCGSGWLPGGQGLQAGDGGRDVGPGPASGERQPQAAAAAHEPSGGGQQAQAQPFGFPAAGGPGQGEHLGPGREAAGQGDDLAPYLALGEALERAVPQPGVLGAADPILAPGPLPAAELQVSELAASGVGGEGGEAVAVVVGEPQPRAGVRPLLADDDPHPGRPAALGRGGSRWIGVRKPGAAPTSAHRTGGKRLLLASSKRRLTHPKLNAYLIVRQPVICTPYVQMLTYLESAEESTVSERPCLMRDSGALP
jgi:hypothetical protein